jgi:DNA-binding MarR family transcriptional regulator
VDRLANLLGAAATAIHDAHLAAAAGAEGLTPAAAAVILTLGQHEGQSVKTLARIAGLTHSATVRLLDGLADRGLVARGAGRDGREVAVALTEAGREIYGRLRAAQAGVLVPLLAPLPPADRQALERALAQVLTALTKGRQSADHICRFCDEDACDPARCPVERQALALGRP